MSATSKADQALLASIQSAIKHAPQHPYTFEGDRWLDLIMLMLIESAGLSKVQASAIAGHLGSARDAASKDTKQQARLRRDFEATIRSPDFDHSEMDKIAASISEVAAMIKRRYGGGIQTFLRFHGNRMVKELFGYLRKSGVAPRKAHRIATVWMQNVANMPVLSTDEPHVRAFCKKYGLTLNAFFKAADRLALNVAYLDDILLVNHFQSTKGGVATKKTKKKSLPS
jgi:hypothetical protein